MKKTLIKQLTAFAGAIALASFASLSAIAQTTQSPTGGAETTPGATTPGTTTTPGATTPGTTTPSTTPSTTTPGITAPSTTTTPGATTAPTSPQANANIVELASSSSSFQTLVQAVEAAGLAEILAGEGPYTVFAPTDEAFAELPAGALQRLLLPENRELLRQVLAYHVVEGKIPSSEISTGTVDTMYGGVSIRVDGGQVIVNDASVIQPDIQASNGIIHGINRVLLPPQVQEQLGAAEVEAQ